MSDRADDHAVSVVVIGRNEGARLVACLQSVRQMNFPRDRVEIIYVDSDSTDGSQDAARALDARVLTVRPERPCAAVGRNEGWRAATHPFVLFLDGDTILHPEFVNRAFEELERRPEVAVVWGHRRETRPGDSIYNRVLDLDWVYPPGVCEFCGGDALMRRSVLEEIGGYDDSLIAGEEPEMCQRMRARGHEILHIDAPMTGHDLAMRRFKQYWRRAVRAGHAYAEISERFRGTETPLWQEDARRNRRRGAFLLLAPVATLVLAVLLRSWWPLAVAALLLVLVIARTTWKTRWKSSDLVTRVLYAIHSQIQQIPIFQGQLEYGRLRRAGKRRALIEYKETV